MLHHVSVGAADVERAAQFYDAVLGALGYARVMDYLPHAIAYGETGPDFWVQIPQDKQPASVGNGTHIGFTAKTKSAVDAFHAAAMKAGGTDNGAPGPRPDYGPQYYGAFVIDLDGNRLEAVLYPMDDEPDAKPKRRAAKTKTKPAKKTKPAAKSAGAAKRGTAPKRKAAASKGAASRRKSSARKSPARRPGRPPARKR